MILASSSLINLVSYSAFRLFRSKRKVWLQKNTCFFDSFIWKCDADCFASSQRGSEGWQERRRRHAFRSDLLHSYSTVEADRMNDASFTWRGASKPTSVWFWKAFCLIPDPFCNLHLMFPFFTMKQCIFFFSAATSVETGANKSVDGVDTALRELAGIETKLCGCSNIQFLSLQIKNFLDRWGFNNTINHLNHLPRCRLAVTKTLWLTINTAGQRSYHTFVFSRIATPATSHSMEWRQNERTEQLQLTWFARLITKSENL